MFWLGFPLLFCLASQTKKNLFPFISTECGQKVMEEINSKITYAVKYLQVDSSLPDNKQNRKHLVLIPVAERALSSE